VEIQASTEAAPMQLFIDGKVDAFLGFGTECQELRARKIGHSIVSGVLDRPYPAAKAYASTLSETRKVGF
jgi:hypothetical protein